MVTDPLLGVIPKKARPGLIRYLAAFLLLQAPALAVSGMGQDAPNSVYRNTAPGVGYVGSRVCGGCHAAIYEAYLKTDMCRSMSLPGDPAELARIPSRVTVHDSKLNRYFETFRQGSDMFQSEYELAPNGTEVFRNTQKIGYVIGSGANGAGYIVRQGNYLLEAPLSFYMKSQSWALSPGYEFGDYGTREHGRHFRSAADASITSGFALAGTFLTDETKQVFHLQRRTPELPHLP